MIHTVWITSSAIWDWPLTIDLGQPSLIVPMGCFIVYLFEEISEFKTILEYISFWIWNVSEMTLNCSQLFNEKLKHHRKWISHCSIRPLVHEFKITKLSIWTSFNIQQINCAQLDIIKVWNKDAKTPDRRTDYNPTGWVNNGDGPVKTAISLKNKIHQWLYNIRRYSKDECRCVTIYTDITAFNDMMDFDVFNHVWNNRFPCCVIGFAIKCKLWKSFLMIKYRFYEMPNFIRSPDDSHWQNKQLVVTWSISYGPYDMDHMVSTNKKYEANYTGNEMKYIVS